MAKDYDVLIIGGGPAGLTAGLYCTRDRLRTTLLERGAIGGKILNAALVENYPGFPEGISGYDLTELMYQQAIKHGLETTATTVAGIEFQGDNKLVKTDQGDYQSRAIIVAGGSELSKLGVPGEETLVGRGVSYCATCDGPLFSEQVVAVVGGGNAAVSEALHLTQFASRVVLIHRRAELRASRILQERAMSHPRIETLWETVVEEIHGNHQVERVKLRNVKTGQHSDLEIAGIFIMVGLKPNTDYLRPLLKLDDAGHVMVNERMETNVPGIYAAGDIRHNSIRQVIAAAGDGAVAAFFAESFVRGHS
ncbi:MAG: thioredoxin-disulfide reductase [Chloroflexi bacterium]|nr:thioredoxin-disulfide reductase [Chloroflexota bacterium]